MMPCIPYLSYLLYIPYIQYIWNVITTPTIHTIANIHAIHTTPTLHRKYSIPVIVTIHTIQTIHIVISNIPYPSDLHTIPTIHTIPTTHAIPDRPYTPYIPNIPYHTPTTPQGGRGTVPHPHHTTGGEGEDLIWGQYMGPIPWGRGGGGGAGPGAYVLIEIYGQVPPASHGKSWHHQGTTIRWSVCPMSWSPTLETSIRSLRPRIRRCQNV